MQLLFLFLNLKKNDKLELLRDKIVAIFPLREIIIVDMNKERFKLFKLLDEFFRHHFVLLFVLLVVIVLIFKVMDFVVVAELGL